MTTRALTPPPLQGLTAKERKYDRQLRLWAASGQEALEQAHVLLLNSGPGVVGVETLKNLILPGIGSFTVVDEQDVIEEDLGINFFLTDDSLGKSRASETCRYLTELNPDVNGHPVQSSLKQFFEDPEVLNRYNLILFVASPTSNSHLQHVTRFCKDSGVPLFHIHSAGLYSHFSVQLPEDFPIVDTHPDPASTQDLRLLQPWPELHQFMRSKTKDLDNLSDHDHGHLPYLLLLLHLLDEWKQNHNGNPPSNYSEKKEFKALLQGRARTNNPEGGEENFDEAAAAVLKSLNKPELPSGLRTIFEEVGSKALEKDAAHFWLIAIGIQRFHTERGCLPLPGALPDMKAQSTDYIQLQNIYKTKARQDIERVTKLIRAMERVWKRPVPIDAEEIEAFCKGAAFVKLIKGRPLLTNPAPEDAPRLSSLVRELKDESSLVPIYVAFLAYDTMTLQDPEHNNNRNPIISLATLKQHTTTLISQITSLAQKEEEDIDAQQQQQTQADILARVEPVLEELVRAGGAELHNISALTGGMVAQEAIKVLTKQYVPVDNTCVFDGIGSRSAVFRV
ncbi:MAG: hypothetical protein Q9219_001804 [cf. Caloplaca sp. 3 TL-2023]